MFIIISGLINQIANFKSITQSMISELQMKTIKKSDSLHFKDGIFYHADSPSKPAVS